MDELSASWNSIELLWSEESLQNIICCHCSEPISRESAFTRTFAVSTTDESSRDLQSVRVSAFSDRIELFYRHLACLFESGPYVVVSHVWEKHVAELQYKRREAYFSATDACAVLREVPLRIFEQLKAELSDPFEIWLDYISVPQWADTVKQRMLTEISEVFRRARLTVAYLADVDEGSFSAMRTGASTEERCRGIARICRATWFSRVWTAMEFTCSSEVRVMAQDFKLIPLDAENEPITHELTWRWREEVARTGVAHDVEYIAWQEGKGLVPWQLGPLVSVRRDHLAGRRVCFGTALSLLTRRRATIQRDFLHALEGLVNTGVSIPPDADIGDTLLRIAHSCILTGDLSPLLVKPASAPSGLDHMELGYIDHAIWGLGREQQHAAFPAARRLQLSNSVVVEAEKIGVFITAIRFDWEWASQIAMFREICYMAVQVGGPDVDRFVNTVGARLYGQTPGALRKRLDAEDRRSRLAAKVRKLHDNPEMFNDCRLLEWIADTMGLSNMSLGDDREESMTPMTYLQHHGLTVHHIKLGAIAHLVCTKCHVIHLLRVALFKRIESLKNSGAYRLPGLKFHHSHAGGAGFLLQDRRIVGRFVWGYPTCSCPHPVGVEVTVDDLPMTMPGVNR